MLCTVLYCTCYLGLTQVHSEGKKWLCVTLPLHSVITSSPLSSCLKCYKWNETLKVIVGLGKELFSCLVIARSMQCKHIALNIGPTIAMTTSVEATELKSEVLKSGEVTLHFHTMSQL